MIEADAADGEAAEVDEEEADEDDEAVGDVEAVDSTAEWPTVEAAAVPAAVAGVAAGLLSECRTIEANDTEAAGGDATDELDEVVELEGEAEAGGAFRAPGCIDDG